MPWWSWILVWVALLALSLIYVFLLGLKLWRDASTTMRAFSDTQARMDQYWAQKASEAREAHVTEERTTVPGSAVFATPEQMKDDYLAAKEERRFARLQRRVARRKERGQLQSLRDIEALEDVG